MERRSHPRFNVVFPVHLEPDSFTEPQWVLAGNAHSHDVSEGGIQVSFKRPPNLEVGRIIKVTLFPTGETEEQSVRIRCKAKVTWLLERNVGLQIVEIGGEDLSLFASLIGSLDRE